MFQAIIWRLALRLLVVACTLSGGCALAQGTLLRVGCDDDNAGAEVSVNGVFKGECPLDMRVPAGSVKLEAVKKVDDRRERAFTQEFRVGDGVTKRVDVVLGPVQLNAEGRRVEAEKLRLAQEARERAEQERQAAAAAAAQARQQRIDDALAEFKAQGAEPGNGRAARECADCPEMVLVPGLEDRPPLAVGRYEVTVGEYAAFAQESVPGPGRGCYAWEDGGLFGASGWKLHPELGWDSPGFPQTPRHPAVCVTWDDAQAYVRWLSLKTGHRYQLPSKEEWANADGQIAQGLERPWKLLVDPLAPCRYGNLYDRSAARELKKQRSAPFDCTDEFVRTAPVGSFAANRFGIHDLWGNAAEMLRDAGPSPGLHKAVGLSWEDGVDGVVGYGGIEAPVTASARYPVFGLRVIRHLEDAGTTPLTKSTARAASPASAARGVPAAPILDPERFVPDKVRAEIARLRVMVPPAQGGKVASLTIVGRNADGERVRTVTVRRQGDLCVRDHAGGPMLIYHSAGLLAAGSNQPMRFIDERAATIEQRFEGNIATLSPGQTLLAQLTNRSLPGETRITVQETRPTWPEYGFAGAATRLKVVRDYETRGGYYTTEEAMLYSPDVGCALPVAEDELEISGNKLFGNKRRASMAVRSIALQE